MKIKIEIKTDNAAFETVPGIEAARILRAIANNLEDWTGDKFEDNLRDINGNTVGTAKAS